MNTRTVEVFRQKLTMHVDIAIWRIGTIRFKPVVVVTFCVVFCVCLQLCSLMFYTNLQQKDVGRPIAANTDVHFIYSNEMLFETIEEVRKRNCNDNSDMELYRNISLLERRRKRFFGPIKAFTKRLPGCIIIGTYKSGTRELIDFLYMHPQVVIRRDPFYELAYFDKHVNEGLDWYRNEMPESLPGQVTVEKSPSYFYSDETPRRIHEMNSSVKLILIVRRPLDRAISQFTFENSGWNRQNRTSFYQCAIDVWTKKINRNCRVLRHSVYDQPMSRYLRYFDRSQILILEADDFRQNPFSVMKRVEAHIGLKHVIHQDDFVYNPERNIYCIRSTSTPRFGSCYDRTRGRSKYRVNITDSVVKQLNSWFEKHNERFFKLIGMRFSWN